MITRQLEKKLLSLATQFPIVGIFGPRQSGKTTLAKHTFPSYTYVSMEDPDKRMFATMDPRGFLSQYGNRVILDEIQKSPNLCSYLQTMVDEHRQPGQFIITGSENYTLHHAISQTLAGRVAVCTLLPLSIAELDQETSLSIDNVIIRGLYPRLWERTDIEPEDWYGSYVATYLERDVRQLKSISDLTTFQRFLTLCAGRTGQLLNLSSLANDVGISHNTIRSWISVLETSYIVFLLPPYFTNRSKRLIKTPKLYFYDPGLAAYLIGLRTAQDVQVYYQRGALFETLMLAEARKLFFNNGDRPPTTYYRDKQGIEIDLVIELPSSLSLYEFKGSQTIHPDMFAHLKKIQTFLQANTAHLVYAGNESSVIRDIHIMPWRKAFLEK